jgi:mannan endo-1,4-beta-mannosidase
MAPLVAMGVLTALLMLESSTTVSAPSAGASTHSISVALSPPAAHTPARRIALSNVLPSTAQPVPGAPDVVSVSPAAVPASGGTTVIITGSGFGSAESVFFGANASSNVAVLSPTTITATVPTNSGTVNVSVVNRIGTSIASPESTVTYVPTGQLPITAFGQSLEVGGVPTKFTGVNAYELASDWGTNNGCGGMETPAQMASFFSSLAPGSLVRFWAFQGDLATDVTTHSINWGPIDQVFYLAAEHHVYLIPVITDQGGTCDGQHWQDPAWYAGGYKDIYNTAANSDGSGLTPLSYWTYMQALVNRYKNSPALGMWEPISEAEASSCASAFQPTNCSGHQTCPDETAAAADLISFFDTVGGEIHTLDPKHLVEEGLLGGSQCGMTGPLYQAVGASPGVDVLSIHDYYGSVALGGDQQNGLAVRFSQAAALDKPIISGEVGILAGNDPSCDSFAQRSTDMAAKMRAQFSAGSSAFLVWNWVTDPLGPCNYNTGPGDPLLTLLANGA